MKLLRLFLKAGHNLPIILRLITIFIGSLFSTLIFSLTLGLIVLTQNEFKLPNWVSEPIFSQIETNIKSVKIENSDIYVSLDPKLRPMLTFDNSVLTDLDGQKLLSLRQLKAIFSLRQVILGQFGIIELALDGLIVSVFKNSDGSIAAQFGGPKPNSANTIFPADLKTQIDQFFMHPQLAAFNSLEVQNITLNYFDSFAGRNWTIDGARFHLAKVGNELVARTDLALLTGGSGVAVIEGNLEAQIGQRQGYFVLKFSELPSDLLVTQSSAFVWLEALKSPISGTLRGSLDASGELKPLKMSVYISNGILQPDANSNPLAFDRLITNFTYKPKSQTLNFDSVSLASTNISLTAEGNAFIQSNENQVVSLVGRFTLNDIKINPQNAYEKPINLDYATIDLQFLVDPFKIQLKELYANDAVRNIEARMSAVVSTDSKGWTVSIDSEIDQISSKSLLMYWPEVFKPKPRQWMKDNILKADFSDVKFSLRYDTQNNFRSSTRLVFHDMTFRTLPEFPLIEKANGVYSNHAYGLITSFRNAVATAGNGDSVDLSGSQFVIPDTKIKPSPAELSLTANGRLRTILEMLSDTPFVFLDLADQITEFVDGTARIEAEVTFPIQSELNASDIRSSAVGEVLDFKVRNPLSGQFFSGSRARFELTPDTLILQGITKYKDVDLDTEVTFDNDTGKTSVVVGLEIDKKLVESLSIPIPSGLIVGGAPADLKIVFPSQGNALFNLESDLVGITLKLDEFDWEKSENTVVDLSIVGHFENDFFIDDLSVAGAGLQLSGRVVKSENTGESSFKIEKFAIDDSIDISGNIKPDGSFDIKKGYFDVRPFLLASKKSSKKYKKNLAARVQLDKVQVTKKLSLKNFEGDLDIGQGLFGKFSADFGPKAKVKGLLKPVLDKTQAEFRSRQAGAVLTEFGVVKKAVGGDLLLNFIPAKKERALDGYLKATNVKIQGVPILAELLNAVSIIGLIDLLSGPGISFNEIESKFRIAEEELIIKRVSAFGPSMGITLDGYYNLHNETFDMQGTISPLYLINSVGSVLSQKGEGLLGFSFILKGKADNFDLNVNPLSVFTPAIFRDIFRRPPPAYEE